MRCICHKAATYISLSGACALVDTDICVTRGENSGGVKGHLGGRAAIRVAILLKDGIAALLAGVEGGGRDPARKREDFTTNDSVGRALAVRDHANRSVR
jgi:hypothetical protein